MSNSPKSMSTKGKEGSVDRVQGPSKATERKSLGLHNLDEIRVVEEVEEVHETGLCAFIKNESKKYFNENIPIPMIKELPHLFRYPLGAGAYMLLLGVFIYFLYQNYMNSISKAFVSLNSSDGDCNEVPIAVTGTYLADINGNWINTPQFNYYLAAYSFTFAGLQVNSLSEFQSMMNVFRENLRALGTITPNQNLAINLIIWMVYIKRYSLEYPDMTTFTSVGYGQLQSLQMTGAPHVVFNARFYLSAIADQYGRCELLATTSFDPANSMLSSTYNATAYDNSTSCTRISQPVNFGTRPGGVEEYTIGMDVRSFSIAMAVNLGILSIDDLQLASISQISFTYNGVNYAIGQYFDVRSPLMDALYCLRNTSVIPSGQFGVRNLCLMIAGSTPALPTFNHVGFGDNRPELCDCKSGSGRQSTCNSLKLVAGLVFYNLGAQSSVAGFIRAQTGSLLALLSRFSSYRALNAAAYNATATSVLTQGYQSGVFTKEWQESIFQFCHLPNNNITCSVSSFFVYNPQSVTVSPYHYQLTNGSCSDTVTIPDDTWDKLSSNPPVPLTQNYYECYMTQDAAFLNAVGVASGNSSIAMLVFMIVLLPVIYTLLAIFQQVPEQDEYSERQRQIALDTFSAALLRIRDHKLDPHRQEVLDKLYHELVYVLYEHHDEEEGKQSAADLEHAAAHSAQSNSCEDVEEHKKASFGRTRLHRMNSTTGRTTRRDPESSPAMRSQCAPIISSPEGSYRSTTPSNPPNQPSLPYPTIRTANDLVVAQRVLPQDNQVRVLNAPPSPSATMENRQADVYKVVDRMLACFGRAMIEREKEQQDQSLLVQRTGRQVDFDRQPVQDLLLHPSSSSDNPQNHLHHEEAESHIHTERKDSEADSVFATATTIPPPSSPSAPTATVAYHATQSSAFLEGYEVSLELVQIYAEPLISREEHLVLLVRLSNALCMHASLEYNLNMKEVANTMMAQRIAYNIGGRIFTHAALVTWTTRNQL
eukprot:gene4934-5417_t